MTALPTGLWETAYHIGVVVPDLAVAMRDIAEQLGITFDGPRLYAVNLRYPTDAVRPGSVLIAYGRQGPPYLELLEAVAESPWPPEGGARLHHVGVRADDLAGELARLGRRGFRQEVIGGIDGHPESFAYLVNDFGMRIEVTTGRGRDTVERGRAERG